MSRVLLEAVPNFSEGRREKVVSALAAAIEAVPGVDVAWRDADPDHNRSVITYLGAPKALEEAAVRGAQRAAEVIDLREHDGVHPRVGALDVLPVVPLAGAALKVAVETSRRVAQRIADEVGIPVYLYGAASEPPGRRLAELRRRGAGGLPAGRAPDYAPPALAANELHATAGAVCVGARTPLLAWNVYLERGTDLATAREIAGEIRETAGGYRGLRALGLRLASRDRVQVSMNLECPEDVAADEVYRRIDRLARGRGARAAEIEVIGLIPDAAADAFERLEWGGLEERLISTWVLRHTERRAASEPPERLRDR